MKIIKDIEKLIKNLKPTLQSEKYFIITYKDYLPSAIGLFKEEEGMTFFIEEKYIRKINIEEKSGPYALISLKVYSDLKAVGLIAKLTKVLAEKNISVNIISAYFHDHLFIPWKRKEEALVILKKLSNSYM